MLISTGGPVILGGSVQDSNGDNNFTIDIASLFLPDGTMKVDLVYTIRSL